jgi:8-amino-7-oxononanoate synthase
VKPIEAELEQISSLGLRRVLVPFSGIDFASNDFLGLSRSPAIREAMVSYLQSGGALGATGSRLVSGENALVREIEDFVSSLYGMPAALFFGSGYLANVGLTAALACDGCEFFSDELNHASLIDGMRLTRQKVSIFRHNDLNQLADLLQGSAAARKIIVTESIFSQEGDGPDLHQLKSLMDEADSFLILDEAHATGVCGPSGLGRGEGISFDPEKTLLVHTCGKALGGYGAFILTGSTLREILIQKARTFIFSTALSPLCQVQTRAALEEVHRGAGLREKFRQNVESLAHHLDKAGLRPSGRHIVSVSVPGNERARDAANRLMEAGFFVRAMRAPTVPAGRERLRITVKAFHKPEDYQRFAHCLRKILAP